MKIEIEVKYNIGDVVLVKDTSGNGGYVSKSNLPIKATISGYTITKDKRKTTLCHIWLKIRRYISLSIIEI